MSETPEVPPFYEQIRKVGKVRSGMLAVAWTVEALNERPTRQAPSGWWFEMYEGLSFLMKLMADELADVYQKLNKE